MSQSKDEAFNLVKQREQLKEISPKTEERILDISYAKLTSNPIGVIQDIYDHFGYEFTDEYKNLLEEYMVNNPKGKHGKVSYSLSDYGLTKEDIQNEFDSYINTYSEFF